MGFFVCLLSFIFWMIDERSRGLLKVTKSGLVKCEANVETKAQLFTLDEGRSHKWIAYTTAFSILFGFQFLFGAFVFGYGLCKWLH